MHKMLWFDTETTGLDPVLQDVIQIAGKIIVGGDVKEEFNFLCQPFSFENIQQQALDTNGRTVEELRGFDHPRIAYTAMTKMLGKHCNKFNKADKFVACGQNVRFDMEFTSQWFKKNGDDYFFSWVFPAPLCTMQMAVMLEIKEKQKIFIPNYKLETLCKCLGVELDNAHNALADIEATRKVASIIWKRLVG